MFLKTPAAAEYLGISVSFLEKRRVYGDGPPFLKLGRGVVYRVADLEAWAAAQVRNSTSEAVDAA